MKHIFYVHSHITYIVSRSVILQEGIPLENTYFIFGRGYTVEDLRSRYVNLTDDQIMLTKIPTYGERFLIRKLRILNEIDRILARAAQGETFVLYLPSTKNYLMQFMVTNPRCLGFKIIEEGLSLYAGINVKTVNPYYQDTFIGHVKARLKYMDHLGRSTIYHKKLFSLPYCLYTISDDLKRILPNEPVQVLHKWFIPEIPSDYRLAHESVFFFDGSVEQHILELEEFERVFGRFVQHWQKTGKRLWLKFHPANTKIQTVVYSLLKQQAVDYVEIPLPVCPEAILLNSTELSVYGIYSSLLYYAAKFGHSAFSLSNLIETPTAVSYVQSSMPRDFFAKVAQIGI